MSLGTSNRDGGKTSESGHLRALGKITSGDIIEGLAASQRAAGVNMSVDIAIGDAFVRRSDGSYAHPVFNDAVYNQVISAADGSNPRRDIVVIYVDYGQTPSTAVSNNTNGVVKIKVVNGTPAGSPVDPNGAAIQASVGSGNPYSILARVRVPAGQTTISNSLIDDLRVLIYAKTNSVPTAAIQDSAVTAAKQDKTTIPTRKVAGVLAASVGWNYIAIDQTARLINIKISQQMTTVSAGDPLQLGLKNTNTGSPATNVTFMDSFITVSAAGSGTPGGDARTTTADYFARTYNGGTGSVQAFIMASLFSNNIVWSKGQTLSSAFTTQYDGIANLTSGISANQYLGIKTAVAGNITYEIEYIY